MKYTVVSHRLYCSHSEECAVSLSCGNNNDNNNYNNNNIIIIIIIIIIIMN